MSKPILAAAFMFIAIPACNNDPNANSGFSVQGCGSTNGNPTWARDGQVSGSLNLGSSVHDVTVSALDLDANRAITNTETYPGLDHGFALDLPGGHYDIEVTDDKNALIARYEDIVVDGDVALDAPTLAKH